MENRKMTGKRRDSAAQLKNPRGFTLVELMVVVVVIAILSSLAMVGYSAYMDEARVTRLKAIVVSLAAKQTDAMSRQVAAPFSPGGPYSANQTLYQNILGFNEVVSPDIVIETQAWTPTSGGACSRCGTYNIPAPNGNVGFFAVAEERLGGNAGPRTIVYMTHETPTPVVLEAN